MVRLHVVLIIRYAIDVIGALSTNENQASDRYAIDVIGALSTNENQASDWYAIIGDELHACVFPFRYKDAVYDECVSGDGGHWCATLTNFTHGDGFHGKCTKVVQRNPPDRVVGTYTYEGAPLRGKCYAYMKRENTFSYGGIFYAQLKTIMNCQYYCNSVDTCRGINFEMATNYCFLGFSDSFKDKHFGSGVDHYTRSPCTICNDSFTKQINTTAQGGKRISSINTVESCTLECLSFVDPNAADFCVGFDFYDYSIPRKCVLHTKDKFNIKYTAQNMYHYTRHTCIPIGNYE